MRVLYSVLLMGLASLLAPAPASAQVEKAMVKIDGMI
jgi:hypothetical protein